MTGRGQERKMPDLFPFVCIGEGDIWKKTKKHHAGEARRKRRRVQVQKLCRIVKRGIKNSNQGNNKMSKNIPWSICKI